LPWFYKLEWLRFNVDGFVCQMCKKKKAKYELVGHHAKMICEGGENNLSNLLTLCKECHTKLHSIDWSKNLYN
jgi:5-methylcytosine-specific restriction endonuclease McrA